ncbi:MAG: hypothetical protein RL348_1477 [Bacteroidota bacterium]|jgi:CRISPR/Cas system-associated protein endoribonuclease Cas2
MKAILEFDLPEDQRKFEMANQAPDMVAAIGHFEDKLRSYIKYGHEFKSANEALEAVRALLHDEINIRGINIHDC